MPTVNRCPKCGCKAKVSSLFRNGKYYFCECSSCGYNSKTFGDKWGYSTVAEAVEKWNNLKYPPTPPTTGSNIQEDKHMIYKIINKKIPDGSSYITFGDLKPGALFKLGNDLFMKMQIQWKMVGETLMQCLTDPNAVNLDNGEPIHIENFIPIEHYVGDVTFDNDKFEGIKW